MTHRSILAAALAASTLAAPAALARADTNDAAERARERYYSTYGTPTPAPAAATPTRDASGDGTPWPTIALVVAGGGLVAGTGVGIARHGRRSRVPA
jgi:hypothetical protein